MKQILALGLLILGGLCPVDACTGISFTAKDGACVLHGRSSGGIVIFPANMSSFPGENHSCRILPRG